MNRSIKNYFTTGELSALCQIPRKTLLYYDKLGLISPEVVDDNGYRYYKRSQLFLLELIITLRHLDVSLKDIQSYLNSKTPEGYILMLKRKKAELDKQINELRTLSQHLEEYIPKLENGHDFPIGEISIQTLPDQYLYLSNPLKNCVNFKTRSSVSATLFTDLRKKHCINQHFFGYMMDNTVLNGHGKSADYIKYYFYPLTGKEPQFTCTLKPAGTYITLYCNGVYMTNNKEYLQKIANYCKEHELVPDSYIYVTYIKNYWLTDKADEYIFKIELRIK